MIEILSITPEKKMADIVTGNKLIAEFMGYTVFDKRYPRNHGIGGGTLEDPKHCIAEKLKYHTSWDWLMPVVEKIESLTNNLKPDGVRLQICIESRAGASQQEPEWIQQCIITFNQHPKFRIQGFDKKEVVWKCVVLFIQWYNQNKNENTSTK